MLKKLGTVTAQKQPTVTIESKIKKLTKPLHTAAQFITESREEVLKTPVLALDAKHVVAVYCVLNRMMAALHRRLAPVRARLEAELAKLPAVQPGGLGNELEVGPFKVLHRNVWVNKKVVSQARLWDLLREKSIPQKEVLFTPAPPAPFLDENKVLELVKAGRISEKEYESVLDSAPPKLNVEVVVPDMLDDVIQQRLLGGLTS